MLLPPSEELTTAITSKNITCPLPLYTGYGTSFFSLSTDGSINTMNANLPELVSPPLFMLTAFAGKYVNEWVTLSASALATVINEKAKNGGSAGNHRKLSPNVSISLKPFHK